MSDVLAVICILGAIIIWFVINELNYRRTQYFRQPPPSPTPVIVFDRRRVASRVTRPSAADSSYNDEDDYDEDDYEDDEDEDAEPPRRTVMQSSLPITPRPVPSQPTQAQPLRYHQYLEGVGMLIDVFPWLGDVEGNDPRTGNHHTLIAGESDAGKSTLARAMLICRSYSGWVLVLNPHAKRDNWGVPVIGGGRNFEEINRAMELLLAEMDRRYDEPEGVEFESLSIFIDEWPSIQDECPTASRFMKKLAMEGRKVRMRLVILSQSRLVEDLGLKGSSDIKKSFSTVLLGTFAQQQMKELKNVSYPGLLLARGQELAMVTSKYPAILYDRKANPDHFYKLPGIVARATWSSNRTLGTDQSGQQQSSGPAGSFASIVTTTPGAEKVSETSGKTSETFSGPETGFPASQRDFDISEMDFSPAQIAKIAAEIGRGEKRKTEIVKNMPGYSSRKHGLFVAYYDQLATAIHNKSGQQGRGQTDLLDYEEDQEEAEGEEN